jgi:hypothetical protein
MVILPCSLPFRHFDEFVCMHSHLTGQGREEFSQPV